MGLRLVPCVTHTITLSGTMWLAASLGLLITPGAACPLGPPSQVARTGRSEPVSTASVILKVPLLMLPSAFPQFLTPGSRAALSHCRNQRRHLSVPAWLR